MNPEELMSGGNMPKEVTGGNAGPATSGSNGQFWTDISNGDFVVGGSKNSWWMTLLTVGLAGVAAWYFFKKK